MAFNLTQLLNKLGDHRQALSTVDLGLTLGPSAVGQAIAHAARGEALCGLGRGAEGEAAFDRAAAAHPIIGRLTSADSMTRAGTPPLLRRADEWLSAVEGGHGSQLDRALKAELACIRGKVAAKRGDPSARGLLERVLREFADVPGECQEARRQLAALPTTPPAPPPSAEMIRWTCEACGHGLNVPTSSAGKRGSARSAAPRS